MPTDAGTLHDALSPPATRLARPALFLDLDGVLAPIAPTPEAVSPDPARTAALRALADRLDGRIAVISGRTIAEIDRICDGAVVAVSGIHGLERRDASGVVHRTAPSAGVALAHTAMTDFARTRPGVTVEDKALAVGLHYRQAPEHEVAANDLGADLAERHGLSAQPGQMIIELKTPGSDKGVALTAFMGEAPFAGATPIMVGDDLTDEFGFRAADALGGFGVLVGPRRETAARHGLADPSAVLTWLNALEAAS